MATPTNDIAADILGTVRAATRALYPGAYLPADTPPFPSEAATRAALAAWLEDGAEILHRCRVGKDRQYLRDAMGEFAAIAMQEWCAYQGIEPPEGMRRDAARTVAETEARLAEGR